PQAGRGAVPAGGVPVGQTAGAVRDPHAPDSRGTQAHGGRTALEHPRPHQQVSARRRVASICSKPPWIRWQEEDMLDSRTLKFALAAGTLALLCACVTTRVDLTSSADRLERNAHAMAQDVRADADYPSGFSRDAHALADDARDFRHAVEDHGAN